MNRINKEWFDRIWAHRRKAKNNPEKYALPPFWACVRASIALALNRWKIEVSAVSADFEGWTAVAWENRGQYLTDYGVGQAFSTLVVRGFTVAEYDDGTL